MIIRRSIVSSGLVLSNILGILLRWALRLTGTISYAKIKPWDFQSFGDTVDFTVVPDLAGMGTERVILSNTANTTHYVVLNSTNVVIAVWIDQSNTFSFLVHPLALVADKEARCSLHLNADKITLTVNGTSVHSTVGTTTGPLSFDRIGSSATGTNTFYGIIKDFKFNNVTPLQDMYAVQGNGNNLRASISRVILEEDFDISFWWRRANSSNANGQTNLLGIGATDFSKLALFDTSSATPGRLQVRTESNTLNMDNVLSNISIGQDTFIRVTRTDDEVKVFTDEIEAGSGTATGDFIVDSLGQTNGALGRSNNGILYNVVIVDKTAAVTVGAEVDITDPADILLNDWEDLGSGSYLIEENVGSGGSGLKFAVMTEGEYYKVKFEIYDWVSGAATLYGGAGGGFKSAVGNSNNFYEGVIVASAQATRPDQIQFYASATTSLKIRGITVESVTSFETYSYDLSGGNGDVVSNVDPITGPESSNLITNGTFDTDLSGWAPDSGVSWSDGKIRVNSDALGSFLKADQTYPFEEGKRYRMTADCVVSLGRGSLAISGSAGTLMNTDGTESFDVSFIAQSDSTSIIIKRGDSARENDFTFDNITLTEVSDGLWENYDLSDRILLPRLSRNYPMDDGPESDHLKDKLDDAPEANIPALWADSPNAGVYEDKVLGEIVFDGTQGNYNGIATNIPRTLGEFILVSLEISNWESGLVQLKTTAGGTYVGGGDGVYTYISLCDNTNSSMNLQSSGNANLFKGKVSNLSVKKVTHAQLISVSSNDWESL
jgi:hypothetical protein